MPFQIRFIIVCCSLGYVFMGPEQKSQSHPNGCTLLNTPCCFMLQRCVPSVAHGDFTFTSVSCGIYCSWTYWCLLWYCWVKWSEVSVKNFGCDFLQVLPHEMLEERLQLAQPSSSFPDWWQCGKHDKDLLIGVAKWVICLLDMIKPLVSNHQKVGKVGGRGEAVTCERSQIIF